MYPYSYTYFTMLISTNTLYYLSTSQINDFITIRDRFKVYISSFNTHSYNCSGRLDNSANIHILKDHSLFTSIILDCSISIDMGIVISLNRLQGIREVCIIWYNKDY